jgi:uncharacterized repeat protein (TIGR01451 family)
MKRNIAMIVLAVFITTLMPVSAIDTVYALRIIPGYGSKQTSDVGISILGPKEVISGQGFDYTFVVSNIGPASASTARIVYELPDDFTWERRKGHPFCTQIREEVHCTVSQIPARTTSRLTLKLKATPKGVTCSRPKDVLSHASVGASQTDFYRFNNTSAEIRTKIRCNNNHRDSRKKIDIRGTLTAPDTVVRGSNIPYTVNITNKGRLNAGHISVSLPIPKGLRFLKKGSSGECIDMGSEVLCSNIGLSTGYSYPVIINFATNADLQCGNKISAYANVYEGNLNTRGTRVKKTKRAKTTVECAAPNPQTFLPHSANNTDPSDQESADTTNPNTDTQAHNPASATSSDSNSSAQGKTAGGSSNGGSNGSSQRDRFIQNHREFCTMFMGWVLPCLGTRDFGGSSGGGTGGNNGNIDEWWKNLGGGGGGGLDIDDWWKRFNATVPGIDEWWKNPFGNINSPEIDAWWKRFAGLDGGTPWWQRGDGIDSDISDWWKWFLGDKSIDWPGSSDWDRWWDNIGLPSWSDWKAVNGDDWDAWWSTIGKKMWDSWKNGKKSPWDEWWNAEGLLSWQEWKAINGPDSWDEWWEAIGKDLWEKWKNKDDEDEEKDTKVHSPSDFGASDPKEEEDKREEPNIWGQLSPYMIWTGNAWMDVNEDTVRTHGKARIWDGTKWVELQGTPDPTGRMGWWFFDGTNWIFVDISEPDGLWIFNGNYWMWTGRLAPGRNLGDWVWVGYAWIPWKQLPATTWSFSHPGMKENPTLTIPVPSSMKILPQTGADIY